MTGRVWLHGAEVLLEMDDQGEVHITVQVDTPKVWWEHLLGRPTKVRYKGRLASVWREEE